MPAEPPEPKILALHGFTGLGTDFAPFARLCPSATWHCPNLPGHGPEPDRDCSPTATIDFIHTQVSGLRSQASASNLQPSTLILQPSALHVLLGYSMGARAALLHACKHPKAWDALILISPNPGIEDPAKRTERRAVDEKLAQRIENEGVAAFIEFWQSTPMIRSQKNISADWRDAMQVNRQQHTAAGLAASLRQFGQGSCPNLWPELEKLAMPVLLVSGADDLKYTRIAGDMVDKLPRCTKHTVAAAGHMPHLETPGECADILNNFINGLSEYGRRPKPTG